MKERYGTVERCGKVFGSTAWAAVGMVPYFTNMPRQMIGVLGAVPHCMIGLLGAVAKESREGVKALFLDYDGTLREFEAV